MWATSSSLLLFYVSQTLSTQISRTALLYFKRNIVSTSVVCQKHMCQFYWENTLFIRIRYKFTNNTYHKILQWNNIEINTRWSSSNTMNNWVNKSSEAVGTKTKMTEAFTSFCTWFWNDDFWLPPNVTWHDITPDRSSKITYASFDHLYVYPWLLVVCIFIHRYLMEGCFFRFLGRKLGVKGHRKFRKSSVELNGIIEKEFKAIKKWEHKDILRLSEKLNITERKGSKQAYAALLFKCYMVQWLLEYNI